MSTPLSDDELLDSLNELQIRLGRHREALMPIEHVRSLILEKRKLAERVEKLRVGYDRMNCSCPPMLQPAVSFDLAHPQQPQVHLESCDVMKAARVLLADDALATVPHPTRG
jgi:hypothetical protein